MLKKEQFCCSLSGTKTCRAESDLECVGNEMPLQQQHYLNLRSLRHMMYTFVSENNGTFVHQVLSVRIHFLQKYQSPNLN